MEEKWITGYEGLYTIKPNGEITKHNKTIDNRVLKCGQNGSGYTVVSLTKDKKSSVRLVHRLVAEHFIPNPENKPQVDHIDENKTNCDVSNLRWCTHDENVSYYNTKDGRRYHIELGKKRKEKLRSYEKQLMEERKKVKELQKEHAKYVSDTQKLLEKTKKELELKTQELDALAKLLEDKAESLAEQTATKYDGYIDITDIKFKSVDEMVKVVGKPIKVNGIEYPSCGAAAKYIVKQELKEGRNRNQGTISKELRRYLQGKRPSWKMYERYEVS